ncbi:MAG: efflux RND transporter permease subunit [Brevinematia bacterium]
MSLPKTAVERPVTMMMGLIAIMILGVVALSRLPIDELPNIEFPVLSVITSYEGASPEEVEKQVTRIIEGAVSGVNEIDHIESTSTEGQSVVTIFFNWGANLDARASDVREKLDFVRKALPDSAGTPSVFKFSSSMFPVMNISVTGIEDQEALYDIADSQVKTKLEQVSGVANVSIMGGVKKEVRVDVDRNRLQAYGIGIDTITTLLMVENQNQAGGYTYEGVYKYILRTEGEFKSLEDIKNVIVGVKNGVPVRLREVANVYFAPSESQGIVRINREPGVNLLIYKEAGKNTVQVAKNVRAKLKEISENLPAGVKLSIIQDDSKSIENSIRNVRDSALQGGILAILILLLFLWNVRTVLIIAISIPTSIITTFIAMYFFNVTLNIVSLGGLALGVGMMVDSSIVVLENIFYHRQRGLGKYSASIKGSEEVMLPVLASTFTTVAVFLPIIFVQGFTAQIFRDLALTVSISLLCSLIISITVVPMLASKLVHIEENRLLKPLEDGFLKYWNRFVAFYQKWLEKGLRHKKRALALIFSSFLIVGVVATILVGKEGMPQSDAGQFNVSVTFPTGTRIEYTDKLTKEIEKRLVKTIGSDLDSLVVRINSPGLFRGSGSEYTASIRVGLVEKERRKLPTAKVMENIRNALKDFPAKVNIRMWGPGAAMTTSALTIEVQGDDLEQSDRLVKKIIEVVSRIRGVRNPESNRSDALPEISLRINREIAAKLGLNAYNLSQVIKTAFGGKTATQMKLEGNQIDVVVQLREEDRMSIEDVLNIQIPAPVGRLIPLSSIVDEAKGTGPIAIYRKNNRRVVTISLDNYERTPDNLAREIKSTIRKEVFIPKGFSIEYGGSYKDMQESFQQIGLALLLAVILIYAIMASQFESYIAPFVIMFTVPFGYVGSVLSLLIFGKTLSTVSFIGVVVLAGIVVNNGIILISFMNDMLKEGGEPDKVAVEAGVRRIRPIAMTVLTTILGLIPMSLGLGEGAELYSPLSLSILGGLLVSTLVTLVAIPIIYAGIRNRIPIKIHKDA